MEEKVILKITKDIYGTKTEGDIPQNDIILLMSVCDSITDYRKRLLDYINDVFDFAEDNKINPPEKIREIFESRKMDFKIAQLLEKLKELSNENKKLFLKDFKGIIERGC